MGLILKANEWILIDDCRSIFYFLLKRQMKYRYWLNDICLSDKKIGTIQI